jgi:PAS domain S-box-containing protein
MSKELTILFAEDLITDYELALYEIKKVIPGVKGKRVETREDYENELRNSNPDIVVSDYIMPKFNGMDALEIKQEIAADIPFIMLTGSTNEETAVECMKAGADDYVIKEHIKRLPHCIISALAMAHVKKENRFAQQELIRRESLLRNALNNLTSTFTIYDKEGKIEYMNNYGLILSGITHEAAIGKKEEEIFPPEMTREYLPALYKTYETKESQIAECHILYKSEPRFIAYYFVPTLDEDNNLYKVLGITFDITDRKEAEESMKMAMKRAEEYDQLKSAFLANISHEIRTPLNAIMGFAQMIKKTHEHDEQLSSYLDVIMLSSNQLLDIIKEMIEISQLVSRKSNATYSDFSISELMNELFVNFQFLEESKIKQGIEFKLDMRMVTPVNDMILSDRDKITQILKNLLNNAFKFTYSGTITLGITKSDNAMLHLYISDTGIGISEDKIDLIFDIFRQGDESFTRQYGGVGLGLTICRELVHLLNGEIWAESKSGLGSTFHVILPRKSRNS